MRDGTAQRWFSALVVLVAAAGCFSDQLPDPHNLDPYWPLDTEEKDDGDAFDRTKFWRVAGSANQVEIVPNRPRLGEDTVTEGDQMLGRLEIEHPLVGLLPRLSTDGDSHGGLHVDIESLPAGNAGQLPAGFAAGLSLEPRPGRGGRSKGAVAALAFGLLILVSAAAIVVAISIRRGQG